MFFTRQHQPYIPFLLFFFLKLLIQPQSKNTEEDLIRHGGELGQDLQVEKPRSIIVEPSL